MATILIVDDHVLNRQFLAALLGYDGHTLLAASDGEEGLRLALARRPQLIITDILMPNMDGHQFVLRLRAEPAVAATPVIFYTSTYSTRELEAIARACGVRHVLRKPSAPELILRTVRQALNLSEAAAAAAPPLADGGPAGLDERLAGCLRRAEHDSQLLAELAGEDPELGRVTQRLNDSMTELQGVGLRLSALIDMGLELAGARDPLALLDAACRVARHIGTARYAVACVAGGAGAAARLCTHGLEAPQQAALADMGLDAILGRLLADGRPRRLANPGGRPQALGLPSGHPALSALLAVPVATAGHCYGWIYLGDKLGMAQFSEVDEQAVCTVARQLAVAYENLCLLEQGREHVLRLERELAERRRMAGRLHESEARFRQLAENIDDVFFLTDPQQREMLYVSPAYEKICGRSCASLYAAPRSWMELVHAEDAALMAEREAQRIAGGGGSFDYQYRIVREDGQVRWMKARGFPISDPQGRVYRVAGVITDITEQQLQQQRISRLSQLYAVLSGINAAVARIGGRDELLHAACRVAVRHGPFHMAWAGVVDPLTLNGRVVAREGGAAGGQDHIRFTARPDAPGSEWPASVAVRENRQIICNDIAGEPALAAVRADLLGMGLRSVAALPLRVAGRATAVLVLYSQEVDFFAQEDCYRLLGEMAGDLGFGLLAIAQREQLNYLAYYDVLTGLPNGMLFRDRVAQFLHAAGPGELVAVLVLNLVRFDQLNDALGRHGGDAVLRATALLLGARLREPCSVAHLGGDTFAVALAGLRHGAEAAALLEQAILEPFRQPLRMERQDVRVALRAGIALYPADGGDADVLLRQAEVAMKQARAGAERYLYYAPEMNAANRARLALEGEVRLGLERGEFEAWYQPRVDLQSGRMVSAEALARWCHPARGLVPPTEFIPLAEETGLIVPLGASMIEAVCASQAAWREAGVDIVPVAVNLSAVQFKRGDLVRTIRAALERHGLSPHDVEFELTESVVMDDPERAALLLRELKALGGRLSLDDFGTGYSSLAYLQRFPFDFVKIDRAFVTNITSNPGDAAIATAVIAMAHSLGLRVVAEGVEHEGQLQQLRRQGCDEMQGYYFSPPVPAAQFEGMLREGRGLALASEPRETVG